MTVVDHRRVEAQARAAADDDFFEVLLPEAAELVVTAGHASPAMLSRKMRVADTMACDLLVELEDQDVVGPVGQDRSRQVLVAPDSLAEVLARISELGGGDTSDEVVDEPPPVPPVVSLVKPPADTSDEDSDWWDDDDQPGDELVVRPDDNLELYQPGALVPATRRVQTLVVRARQATARASLVVADQPVVARTMAVTRQAPRAGGRLLIWTPRGASRAAAMLYGWANDSRSSALLAKHADAGEGESYAKVADARLKTNLAGRRTTLAVAAGLVVLVALAWWAPTGFAGVLAALVFVAGLALAVQHRGRELLWALAMATGIAGLVWWQGPKVAALVPQPPEWFWWLSGVSLVVWFGLLGRQEGQKLVEPPPTMVAHKVPPVTAPMVINALVQLDKKQMKEPESIRVLMDPHKVGDGVQLDLELPGSVTAADIIEDREPLAAAMRRELGTVWPAVGPRHPGHLSLFISRVPMVTATQQPWPVATGGPVSIFRPQPLFTDQRGEWVYQTLAYTGWVIGAVPRMGKTLALLNIGLVAAMDPNVRLYVFDLKGTGDLSALAKVAHRYRVGDEPEDIADMLQIMRDLREEMRARTRDIRDLSLDENPEKGKVTEALAARDPDRFGPVVIIADEVQVWNQEFTDALPGEYYAGEKVPKDPGKAVRDEFIRIERDLVKRGPALGYIPLFATQKPDAKSIPSSIADNASARLCFKVNGQISNDQILGTSSYQAGVRATQFAFAEKGIGYFRGDGAEPLVVRTVFMTPERADEIASRARALRIQAGRLTGEAAGDRIEDVEIVIDIVQDVELVLRRRERGKAHHIELVVWLQELRPDVYAALTVDELSTRLRGQKVRIDSFRVPGTGTRRGVYLSSVTSDQAFRGDDDDD